MLAATVGILWVTLAVGELVAGGEPEPRFAVVTAGATLFAAALGWAVFQCLPWAPASWAHPIWREAQALLPDHWIGARIGIDPAASQAGILHLLTYGGVFWLAFRCCRKPERARLLLKGLATVGAAYAAWGLAVYWTGNHSVLWYEKWTYQNDLTSTFVNRNSFATYCGLTIVIALGLLLERLLRDAGPHRTRRTLFRDLAELLSTRAAWLLAVLMIVATALLLTHSRGGSAATAAGGMVVFGMTLLAPSLRAGRRVYIGTGVGVACAALLMLAVSGATTLTRVADAPLETEGREQIFAYTLQAIGERPLLGTGLGTFKTVFQAYRDDSMTFVTERAHNDYLENVLELGVPAALALFAAPTLLLAGCVRGVTLRRRDAIIPAIGVGATVLVGLHSLVDFSLQIPAIATDFSMLLGAAVAQSLPRTERPDPATSSS